MIIDIPSSSDFEQSGATFLNLAWDHVINLLLVPAEFDLESYDEVENVTDKFWTGAKTEIATAAALAQQGIELLLKAKIAGVSPFLLISGDPRDWPRGCDKVDVPFADFRTIDAQDLLRAHDAVCFSRLTDEFKTSFDKLRRMRNGLFHTVDKRITIRAEEVVHAILFGSESLLGPFNWLNRRRDYLSETTVTDQFSPDPTNYRILRELTVITDTMQPSDLLRFIGINKKQRRYLCMTCKFECSDFDPDLVANFAQLKPNSPTSTILHCFACGSDTQVVRANCGAKGCKGNVIEAEDGWCCTCGEENAGWHRFSEPV